MTKAKDPGATPPDETPLTIEEIREQEGSGFNADLRAENRLRRNVTIGGKVYRPRKKTGAVIKALLLMVDETPENETWLRDPETQEIVRDDDNKPIIKQPTREEQLDNLESLYKQIAILVRSVDTDEPPPWEVMEEELDLEDARALMGYLMPAMEDDEGKKKTAQD